VHILLIITAHWKVLTTITCHVLRIDMHKIFKRRARYFLKLIAPQAQQIKACAAIKTVALLICN
jgi:hypothetical protein